MQGSPGLVLHSKLIRLRRRLKNWNWEIFGNVSVKQNELFTNIQVLKNRLQQGWDNTIDADKENNMKKLRQVESWENDVLCQKARMDYTEELYRTTKFYHAVIKERRRR